MLATKIKALCEAKGVSVSEVERAAGIGNGVIRKWDEISPTLSKLKPVCDYLGVTLDEIVRDD